MPSKNIIHKSYKFNLAAYAPKTHTGIIRGNNNPLLRENSFMQGLTKAIAIAYIKKFAINKAA